MTKAQEARIDRLKRRLDAALQRRYAGPGPALLGRQAKAWQHDRNLRRLAEERALRAQNDLRSLQRKVGEALAIADAFEHASDPDWRRLIEILR